MRLYLYSGKRHICFICFEETEEASKYCQKLTKYSFEKVKEFSAAWASINFRHELNERIKDFSFSGGFICHKKCYSYLTRKDLFEISKHKFDKDSNENGGHVYNTEVFGSDEVKLTLDDETQVTCQSMELCTSFLLGIVKQKVLIDEQTVDCKQIEEILKAEMLREGIQFSDGYNFSRYIKQTLQNEAEINELIEFLKCHKRHTVIAAKSFIEKAICEMHYDAKTSTEDDELLTVSKIIRKELSETIKWTFDGDFSTFVRPSKLEKLMSMFIGGTLPITNLNKKHDEIALISRNACDYIFSNYKSDREI